MNKLKQADILHTQENVENNHKEESSSIFEPIEHTPFVLVSRNIEGEQKWFIVMANKRIGDFWSTREQAILDLDVNKWFYIAHMIVIITEKIIENEKGNTKSQE